QLRDPIGRRSALRFRPCSGVESHARSLLDGGTPLRIGDARPREVTPAQADQPRLNAAGYPGAVLTTRFTQLVGCSVPIQQAGMGAVAGPELAAAVSEAGGLGMLGMARSGGSTVRGLRLQVDRLAALTSRPFGINFIVTPESLAEAEPGCFELAARS